jgi:flavin-dependent dehydrogenase
MPFYYINSMGENFKLADGSRVAVIGGGPAGSFFAYFLLDLAGRVGLAIDVDIYEPRDYSVPGAAGCNMCGGIISESMVQLLATEGITLPPSVVQRGIEGYVLHTDAGSIKIAPPGAEKRIASVYRGAGPRGMRKDGGLESFDGYLLGMAARRGARTIRERVESIRYGDGGMPVVVTPSGTSAPYDLLAGATGINGSGLKLFESLDFGFVPPGGTRTFITEVELGERDVTAYFGNAMHVFLLNLPRIEFAAIIPKREYVTVCLLGESIDKALVDSFFDCPQVVARFPKGWKRDEKACRCSPSINISAARNPFADRIVMIGDCGVSRLYKDGIGGAYRTAKAAARTAIFEGVSAEAFRSHYLPVCLDLDEDNRVGKLIFLLTRLIQRIPLGRRAVLRMTTCEQAGYSSWRMSGVLWDTFTGSAPYADVFRRVTQPLFILRFVWQAALALLFPLADPNSRR